MDQFGDPTGPVAQPPTYPPTPLAAPEVVESAPRSRPRIGTGVAIAAVAIGALGLGGVAYAANAANTPSPSPSSSAKGGYGPQNGAPGQGYGQRPGGGMMGHGGMHGFGPGGLGLGLGGAIHGSVVTPKQGGGYQTVDGQRGTVQSVSATSITVKSEDGFSQTYVVTADTLVNAKRDGIASVKKDDKVAVIGIEGAGSVTAVQIIDQTQLKDSWQQWMPGHDKNGQNGKNGATGQGGPAPSGSSTGPA